MFLIGIISAIVFMIVIWILYPRLLSPFDFLVNSPVKLFLGRIAGSFFGGLLLSGILMEFIGGEIQENAAVENAKENVVVLDENKAQVNSTSQEVTTSPASADPQKDEFYFNTPILGFNLGMTIKQLESLMGENKDSLELVNLPNYGFVFSCNVGLGMSDKFFFSDDYSDIFPTVKYYEILDAIAKPGRDNPYGLVVFSINDKSKFPVRVDSLNNITLTFIGGRLIQIASSCRDYNDDIVGEALSKKYECFEYRDEASGQVLLDLIKVDDKLCTLFQGDVINVPYLEFLIWDLAKRRQKQSDDEAQKRQQEMNNI